MTRERKAEQGFLPGMSPGLVRVAEAAERSPGRLLSLAHHIDVDALRRAFHRIRAKAAVGVDGVNKAEYGENLEENLRSLLNRFKKGIYKANIYLHEVLDNWFDEVVRPRLDAPARIIQ